MKASAESVLALLEDHPEGLTALECLRLGGGDSLAQRVHELREAGHPIADTWETTPNGARIKRYRLGAVMVRNGHPVGALRLCPACHEPHHVGTTCAYPSGSQPDAAADRAYGRGVRLAAERPPVPGRG